MRNVATRAGIHPPDSWLAAPITLWRFSRPHTLVGTTISILGIYAIAAAELPGVALGDGVADLALTVLAGAAVNIYIVGLNQCEDVEIDRINKPWLPIPAGRLGLRAAWRIVIGSGVLAAGLAVTQGRVEIAAVAAALAIGTAYSSPPLRLNMNLPLLWLPFAMRPFTGAHQPVTLSTMYNAMCKQTMTKTTASGRALRVAAD